ncbi:MAG: ABC transporter substrate-binding protein [Clostridiales Family XIII bacterium]|jgi:ABC-type branched-subunit amino acid transport system substrate-binding protein|nr:ABC transporter substrate-binding protein [Clostridiales Family XIII bacterium]
MKRKILTVVLLVTLVGAVVLSGCGKNSTGGGSSGGASAGGSAAGDSGEAEDNGFVQGITDDEVVIANSAATSGAYAPVGVPFLAGLQAYLDMVNDAGGIDGRKIKFLHTDDEFDPAKGSAALTEYVEDEKVFAIVGHFGTPVVAATVDQLKEYGIPAVYFATGIGQLYADNAKTNADGYNIFPVQPIYRTEGGIMAAYVTAKFDAKKIGIIYTNDDAGMDLEKGAVAQIESLDGIEYVEEQVAAGAADVSAAVTSLKNANVDYIIIASIQGTFPTIVKELAAQSVNKDCISTYVNCSSAMSEAIIADIPGKFDVYALGWLENAGAVAEAALADFQKWTPEEYGTNAYAETGWIAGFYFTEGLRRLEGQDVTWASYMKALEEAPIQNPFGGIIDYSGGKRLGTQEMNLFKAVTTAESPMGWLQIEPLQSVESLLKQ